MAETPEIIQQAMELRTRQGLKITFHYPDGDMTCYAKDRVQFDRWQETARKRNLEFTTYPH